MPAQKKRPDQVRRRNTSRVDVLPADGREGAAPSWPKHFSPPTKAELGKWDELWSTPQAHMWELLRSHDTVARYVRMLLRSMAPKAPANLLAEVRQMESHLGMSPLAMFRLQWTLGDIDPAPAGVTKLEAYRQATGQEA